MYDLWQTFLGAGGQPEFLLDSSGLGFGWGEDDWIKAPNAVWSGFEGRKVLVEGSVVHSSFGALKLTVNYSESWSTGKCLDTQKP